MRKRVELALLIRDELLGLLDLRHGSRRFARRGDLTEEPLAFLAQFSMLAETVLQVALTFFFGLDLLPGLHQRLFRLFALHFERGDARHQCAESVLYFVDAKIVVLYFE